MTSTPNSPVLPAKPGPPSPPSSPDHYSFDQDRDVDQLTDQVDALQLDDTLGTRLGECYDHGLVDCYLCIPLLPL
jgi:hypothetical protein